MDGETKVCAGCGRERAVRHFHRDRHTRDGYYRLCKQCRRPVQAATAKRRRAERAAYRAAYLAEFPDAERESHRKARAAMTQEERRELWRYEAARRDKVKVNARLRGKRAAARAAAV